jgi:hypothetical protein
VFPVQTAVRYKVPLIIWGAHQGLEQVGMFSHEHEVEMTRRYRKDHDIMGHEADDLLSVFDTLKEDDIWQYRYPDDHDLNSVGVRGIYLGNYVRWDPKAQHEQMMREYDYRTTKFNRTFDRYDFVDCFNYMDLHDVLKLYKHGYSRVTDHASREIRYSRINRAEALALVKKYEQAPLKYHEQFCDWLGMEKKALQFVFNQHRNPEFWDQVAPGEYQFKGWSVQREEEVDESLPLAKAESQFDANDTLEHDREADYITIGRGWNPS